MMRAFTVHWTPPRVRALLRSGTMRRMLFLFAGLAVALPMSVAEGG